MIVSAGESLVDLVPSGPEHLSTHCGGAPFNTARGLARLDQPVSFLGCISDDMFGVRLRAQLVDDGVSVDAVVPSSLPTTVSIAEIDEHGSAQYRFYTLGTAAPALRAEDALGALPPSFDIFYIGSLGLVLEPLASAITAILETEAAGRALVMVDPNIRSALIVDRSRYLKRLAQALKRTDVLKASIEDLAWLAPDRDAAAAARQLLKCGPAVALVTCGDQGALVVGRDRTIAIAPRLVAVVDTIGAGDAFSSGFLAWWRSHRLRRDQLGDMRAVADAAAFACIVASQTCEQAGAAPPRVNTLPKDAELPRRTESNSSSG